MTDQVKVDAMRSWRAEDLTEQARRVRALASGLVDDPTVADDLAQQALSLRVERAHAGRSDVTLPWLNGAVRNLAMRWRRNEGRRRTRERSAAQPEATPSTADAVAHAELLQQVVAAAVALNEPYRSTILMRYLQDMAPAQVAERLGVSEATIRVRCHRALQQLRLAMRKELGAGYAIALWRFASHAPQVAPGTPTSTPTPPSSQPGSEEALRMTKQLLQQVQSISPALVWTAAGLVVAGTAAVLWSTNSESSDPLQLVESARQVNVPDNAAVVRTRPTPSEDIRRETADEPVEPNAGTAARPVVHGAVLSADGHPIAGARVLVCDQKNDEGIYGNQVRVQECFTDGGGNFAVPVRHLVDAEGSLVIIEAPGFAPWRGPLAKAPDITVVTLELSASLQGTILDASTGKPVAGARVFHPCPGIDTVHTPQGQGTIRFRQPAFSESTGRFLLPHTPTGGPFAVRVALPGHLPAAVLVSPSEDPDHCQIRVRPGEIVFTTSAATRQRRPISHARVHANASDLDLGFTGPDGRITVPITRIPDVETPNQVADEVQVTPPVGSPLCSSCVRIAADNHHKDAVDIPLVEGLRIKGQVLDESGTPVAYATVDWISSPTTRLPGRTRAISRHAPIRSDENGRFETPLVAIRPSKKNAKGDLAKHRLLATAANGRQTGSAKASMKSTIVRVHPITSVSGRVTGTGGAPLPYRVAVYAEGPMAQSTLTWTENDGSYVLPGLRPGTWKVRAVISGSLRNEVGPTTEVKVTERGAGGVDLTLAPKRFEVARGRVIDSSGRPVRGATVRLKQTGNHLSGQRSPESLPPGKLEDLVKLAEIEVDAASATARGFETSETNRAMTVRNLPSAGPEIAPQPSLTARLLLRNLIALEAPQQTAARSFPTRAPATPQFTARTTTSPDGSFALPVWRGSDQFELDVTPPTQARATELVSSHRRPSGPLTISVTRKLSVDIPCESTAPVDLYWTLNGENREREGRHTPQNGAVSVLLHEQAFGVAELVDPKSGDTLATFDVTVGRTGATVTRR